MSKVHVRVQTIEDKLAEYVENNSIDIYVDYRDELSDKQIEAILEGKAEDVRNDIEMEYDPWGEGEEYYWQEACEALGCTQDDVDDWLANDGFHPQYTLDDHGWRQLLRNTSAKVTGIVWDAEFNFNNWAYGGPLNYQDVKETLKILGINPFEFKKEGLSRGSGSATSGQGQFKGYFPDMPKRVPKIDPKELWDNLCTLYDGVMTFCLGDLENIAEVLSSESDTITFKKGTNVVFYEFGGGAGITEVQLTDDVTIKRKQVEFRNDSDFRYGVQACYGFVNSYWTEGSIQNGK